MKNGGKKFLIVGAGRQCAAIVHYLLEHAKAKCVTLCDSSGAALSAMHQRFNFDKRINSAGGDAEDTTSELVGMMAGHGAVVGAATYKVNLALTDAAIRAKTHFCDLGGNNGIVDAQFRISKYAAVHGVAIVPDTGVAPGMASILAADGIAKFGSPKKVKSVSIYCGGLPQKPIGPLKYALVFSVSGLINEYKEKCRVLRGGIPTDVQSLTEIETVRIPGIGDLEAAHTSGGVSTLVDTYKGKIDDISYKTLRYPGDPGEPGHWEIMRMFRDLGFFENKFAKVPIGDGNVMPREYLEAFLEKSLPRDQPDVLVLRVEVRGRNGKSVIYDLIDRYDEKTGLTAMQRTTGFSAAIIAEMLANGEIEARGTLRQEQHVPTGLFIERLRAAGVMVRCNSGAHRQAGHSGGRKRH